MAIIETPPQPTKRQNRNEETKIQVDCFTAFRKKYPQYRKKFFAIVNENEQSKYETIEQQRVSGGRRKAKGVVSGVADTCLMVARRGYHGAYLEAKTPTGYQSQDQKDWQVEAQEEGYYYAVFKSVEQLMAIIAWYFGETDVEPKFNKKKDATIKTERK